MPQPGDDVMVRTTIVATSFAERLYGYLRAGFPILYINTWEEERVDQEIKAAAQTVLHPETRKALGRKVYTWTVTKGWRGESDRDATNERDPVGALAAIAKKPENAVYVMRDYHFYLDPPVSAEVSRALRDISPVLKATGRTLIITAPRTVIPVELEKDITLLPYDLPSREDLGHALDGVVESVGAARAKVEDREGILEAARGLTLFEAEQTLALALVRHLSFTKDSAQTVLEEKASIVKKSGMLEFSLPATSLSHLGGFNGMKNYLSKRRGAFSDAARKYGIRPPRGLLIIGVQGCGKTYAAKCISREWGLPFLLFDMGRVFQSLVGQSEENIRRTLAQAEAMAPCVLCFDEMEKGLAGLQSSGQSDGGVTARVFGTVLTWMNEKTAPVYVVATSNDISQLPAELVRKGRFDEIFFVDLPTDQERVEIFNICFRKVNRDPAKFAVGNLAIMADQFSGVEIEEAIMDAMYNAFADGEREVTTADINTAIEATSPLAVTHKDRVDRIRAAQQQHKWRKATEVVEVSSKRRIAVR